MPRLSEAKSHNTSLKFSYTPVAVFVGATTGIGHRTLEALARTTDGKVHTIIVARSKEIGRQVLESLPKPLDGTSVIREFIQCDVAVMKNVEKAVKEIEQLLQERIPNNPPRVNFLFLSAGYADLRFSGRKDTEDGLDHQLVLRYYHRFKFTYELLPLLRAARDAGEDSKVLAVLGAGMRWPIPKEDFAYKNTEHGPLWRSVVLGPVYNDLAFEGFAKREPGIAFTHMNPSFVRTEAFKKARYFSFWPLRPFNVLWNLFSVPEEDSAQFFLYALLAGKPGFQRRNIYATDIGLYDHGVDNDKFWEESFENTKCSARLE